MKVFHLDYETDAAAEAAQPAVDKLDGVLKAEQHPAFGNGPAYLVVITQGDFNPTVFQREYSLAYEDKEQPEPTIEEGVVNLNRALEPEPDDGFYAVEPAED